MPILFFDVDGPMVPARALFLPNNIQPKYGWQFDQCAVGMLNFLNFIVPDLEVVIASHRVGMRNPWDGTWTDTRASWQRIFKENGLDLHIHKDWITSPSRIEEGDTPPKIVEITQWLAKHPKVTTFVTFEDEAAGYTEDVTPAEREALHLCGEDYMNGITWQDLERAAKFLGVVGKLDTHLDKYRKHLVLGTKKNAEDIGNRRINRTLHREPAST